MNTRWWMHPGCWMVAGALAYPVGTAVGKAIVRWHSGAPRGYVFGAANGGLRILATAQS